MCAAATAAEAIDVISHLLEKRLHHCGRQVKQLHVRRIDCKQTGCNPIATRYSLLRPVATRYNPIKYPTQPVATKHVPWQSAHALTIASQALAMIRRRVTPRRFETQ